MSKLSKFFKRAKKKLGLSARSKAAEDMAASGNAPEPQYVQTSRTGGEGTFNTMTEKK